MNINDAPRLEPDIRQQTNTANKKPTTTAGDSNRSNEFGSVDKLFLNNLRPQQATDFLAQHINKRLSERFQLIQPASTNLFEQAQGPGASVNQIVQMANLALRKLAPNHGLPESARQVRNEVDGGYNEALDIFGVFGGIEEKTRDTLGKARELLNNAFQHAPLNGDEAESKNLAIDSQRYRSESSTSLNIETADGDIVTINFSHNIEHSRRQLSYDNGNKHVNFREGEKSQEYEISIEVEGNLSGDEKNAIQQLAQQLSQVTTQQNKGHEQAAAQQATSINYDNDLIKSFDYEHTVDESVENTRFTQQQTTAPLAIEQAPTSNIIEEYSFLPFKDMRKAVQAMLEKIAEFRASLEDTLKETPTTPVREEA